jgi:hypothetical protein
MRCAGRREVEADELIKREVELPEVECPSSSAERRHRIRKSVPSTAQPYALAGKPLRWRYRWTQWWTQYGADGA